VFYYYKVWVVATRDSLQTDIPMCDLPIKFRLYTAWNVFKPYDLPARNTMEKRSISQIFWELWKFNNYKLPTDTGYTYMFDMQIDTKELILTGVTNNTTFKEVDFVQIAKQHCWKSSPTISIDFTKRIKPREQIQILSNQ